MSGEGNGWTEYRNLVLAELERQAKWLGSLQKAVEDLRVQGAVQAAKLTVYAAIGGALGMALMKAALSAVGL